MALFGGLKLLSLDNTQFFRILDPKSTKSSSSLSALQFAQRIARRSLQYNLAMAVDRFIGHSSDWVNEHLVPYAG